MIRTPHVGAAALVAGWTTAGVVNAGDGKHEHPTQALLDVYTLRERLGGLDGLNIWIVGDVTHSRVARSNILAFTKMGAKVTVCGPPTLIPRGMDKLCDVAYSLDELHTADVVYGLRMQKERMGDSFVPSLREYAAQYQINGRRLGAKQVLMHPGPVNRGVELAAEVIDSPQAVIGQQVEAGVVVRMAVLYELLAGRQRAAARHLDPDPRMSQLDHRETPPADVLIKGAHVLDPRTGIDERLDVRDHERHDRRARRRPAGDGEVIDGAGKHVFPGFVDPHVHLRAPGQEHKEDLETGTRSAAAGGFVAVVAMPNTSPTVDSAPILRSLREAARREARVPVGFMARVTTGLHGEALTEMAELRESGALGFTDDGKPVHRAGLLRKALQYQKLVGAIIALHEEDPTLSGKGVVHEGEVSARLGLEGIPSISESTLIARDAAIAGYEDGRIHIQHLSARESVEAVAEAKARGVKITCEASPHHLTLTDTVLLERLDTRLKMNPPLRRRPTARR